MRKKFLLVLPAVCALAGFARPSTGATPLTVDSVYCQSYTTWRFSCVANVSGGSGVYNSYSWTWPQSYGGSPGTEWTYVNEVEGNCGGDGLVIIEVTVRDSNWDTATGYGGFYCTYNGE